MPRLNHTKNELSMTATEKTKRFHSFCVVLGFISALAIGFDALFTKKMDTYRLSDFGLMAWEGMPRGGDNEDNVKKYNIDTNAPLNLHKNLPAECGKDPSLENFHPSILPLLEMGTFYNATSEFNKLGHQFYRGNSTDGLRVAGFMQSCSYANLERFWQLADEYNITRWSAHGGTAMGAYCHGSMNPWDDDLDITLANCTQFDAIFDKLGNVSDSHPNIKPRLYSSVSQGWIGRLLDKDWIIIKGKFAYYKLKSVAEILARPSHDLGGMDIMCFPNHIIPRFEREAMEKSGFKNFCTCSLLIYLCVFQRKRNKGI